MVGQLFVTFIFLNHIPQITLIAVSIVSLLLIHYFTFKDIDKTSQLLAAAFYFGTLLIFLNGSYVRTIGYIWALFSPVFIFYLVGFERGRVWVGSLLVVITVFFLLVTAGVLPDVLSFYALIQSYLALLAISLMSYFFQKMYFSIGSINQYKNNIKIKELKERFELALIGYNAGAYEWNMLDNSAYLSPQWKKMLGYDENTVFPNNLSTWKDRVHPDDIDEVMELVRIAIETKKASMETTHRLKNKNGQWIWILGRGHIQYDKNGTPVRMTGIHTNITKQKQLEEQFANAEMITHFGSYCWNIRTNDIIWSDEHYRILGVDRETFTPTLSAFTEFIHPDDREMVMTKLQDIIRESSKDSSESKSFKFRFISRDGKQGYIQSTSSITKWDDEENAVEMVGTAFDITERIEHEMKLKRVQEELSNSQQIAQLGSWELNLETEVITLSKEHQILLGEAPVQTSIPLSEYTTRYVVEEDNLIIQNQLEFMKQNIDNSDYSDYFEYRMKNNEGGYEYFSVNSYFSFESVINGVTQKITKQKTIENTLQSQNSELVKAKNAADAAAKSKSTFLANMSHEIRTPLNAINGFISLLKKEEHEPKKLKYLQIINGASHTLLNTINDILDISKIESGKLKISKVNFYPYQEITVTIELFQTKASEKKITLSINYDYEIPEVLYSDILRIKQVIHNLLSNALKFTPENGTITLSVKYTDHKLDVTITDNGIGIEQDKLDYIFESFSQAEESTVREYGGSGLGLSISSQLIYLLGGEINVTSTVGEGSTFFFSIPTEIGEMKDTEDNLLYDKDKPLIGNILIVEDIATNRMFISLLLKNNGLTYDEAVDGIEAVEKFETGKYDLILMDENMPRLNGKGAAQKIRMIEKEKECEHIPIIALTANALIGDREKFIDAGMDDYLAKPVEPDTLIAMLHKYLNGNNMFI